MKSKLLNTGLIISMVGNLFGIMLSGVMTWSDIEASLFQYNITGKKKLSSLNCPILLNGNEEREIKVTIKNDRDQAISPYIRAFVSEDHITFKRESTHDLLIQPGDAVEIIWKIRAEDAVYDLFVFFRIYIHDDFPYPSRDGTCGVLVTNIPGLSGNQLTLILFTFSILLIVGGNILIQISPLPHEDKRKTTIGTKYLSGLTLLSIFIAYLGYWVIGLIIWTIIVVLVMILSLQLISGEKQINP